MPLPAMKTARRCHATAKSSRQQCHNPAAYGMSVCRLHGARKPATVLRGPAHPNYQHGEATIEAKADTARELKEIRHLGKKMKMLKMIR
jgi:hypothetical protein